jgi:hypothetical protein
MALRPDLQQFVAEWLQERRDGGSHVWYRMQDMAFHAPDDAWAVMLALLPHVSIGADGFSDAHFHNVHIGAIANYILDRHAAAFVDRMEREAAVNPAFRYVLRHVDLSDQAAPPEVLARLLKASDDQLEIYPGPGTEFARIAYEVAEQYRAGLLAEVPLGLSEPVVPHLARIIEQRYPGRSTKEYETAATYAIRDAMR